MADYERRLARLEQDMQPYADASRILVLVYPGEDRAAKIAEAKRARRLADDDDTKKLIIVEFDLPASVAHG